jgi:ATP-dependent Clp protease ATP-binding subunit ClpC
MLRKCYDIDVRGMGAVTSMSRTITALMGRLRRLLERPVINGFSQGARSALARTRQEARRLNHNFVGTEHLLLAIMRSPSTVAVKILAEIGISPNAVCANIENFVGHGAAAEVTDALPYTPRIKKALALAGKEAKALEDSYVGTQHLLLGLLAENDGVAGRVLKSFNLDLKTVRHKVIEEMASTSREEWKQRDRG